MEISGQTFTGQAGQHLPVAGVLIASPLDEYLALDAERDAVLDRMDRVWFGLSDEDQKKLDAR